MMAGYVCAQMKQRLACTTSGLQHRGTLEDRIVALAVILEIFTKEK